MAVTPWGYAPQTRGGLEATFDFNLASGLNQKTLASKKFEQISRLGGQPTHAAAAEGSYYIL